MAYSASDLAQVEAAILALAKGERVVSVMHKGRRVEYSQAELGALKALRSEMQGEIDAAAGTKRFAVASVSKGF